MNFNKEKYQLKNNDKDKIEATILDKENKKNKINMGINLGKKRKILDSKKNNNHNFIISRPAIVFIKGTNIENHEARGTCVICLNKISFENRHFLHCGHIFHCSCINLWINKGNNLCPICRGNRKCINQDYSLINIDENENSNNNNNNDNFLNTNANSINYNSNVRNNNRIIRNNNRIKDKMLLKYLMFIILIIN